MKLVVTIWLLLSFTCYSCASVSLAPTTTVQNETGNNTAAAGAFTPIPDDRAGAVSVKYLPTPPVNVSNVSVNQLPYSGFNGQVFVNVMGWFKTTGCSTGNAGVGGWSRTRLRSGGHWCIGYDSANASQVHAQVNDMIRRGYKGINYTWNGRYSVGTSTQKGTDVTLNLIKADLEARCIQGSCPFFFFVQPDGSIFQFSDGYAHSSAPGQCCTIATQTDENAFLSHTKDDLCYLNKFFFASPAYAKVNGRPIYSNFFTEGGRQNAAAPSWKDLWTQINTHLVNNMQTNCAAYSSLYANSPNNGVPWMIWGTGSSAFTHDGLSNGPNSVIQGAYFWENNSGNCASGIGGQACQTAYMGNASSFYPASLNYASIETIGAAWAGFDDQLADWSPNPNSCSAGSYCTNAGRVDPRNCGLVWVQSWAKVSPSYSVSHQLSFAHVVTWNDYDEGTAIEAGIDNCFTVSSFINTDGHTVTWNLTATDSLADLRTIDHITVYGSLDCVNLAVLADNIPVTAMTAQLDLNQAALSPGIYAIYVKVVGKNSIVNHWSVAAGGFAVSPPTPGGPPSPPGGTPAPGTGGTSSGGFGTGFTPPVPGVNPTPAFNPFTPATFGPAGITIL